MNELNGKLLLLFAVSILREDTDADSMLKLDLAELNISEITERTDGSTITEDVLSECGYLAPFPQLRHLNLAHNRVCVPFFCT